MNNSTKTTICSVIAIDIIDFAKKSQNEQLKIKALFNQFIGNAVLDIPQADRVVSNTDNGVVIICSGQLEDALEDALFISISIRDEILKNNNESFTPLYVQFGINLGPAQMLKGADLLTKVAGDGVDVAHRIMSFANPNQILVSHVYFEMASKLTQEMAQMFEKYDMHAYEQDVYAVRMLKGTASENAVTPTEAIAPAQAIASQINWLYVATGLLILTAFVVLVKQVSKPTEPTITIMQPTKIQPATSTTPITTVNTSPATQETVVIEELPATHADTNNAQPVATVKPALTTGDDVINKNTAKNKVSSNNVISDSAPTKLKVIAKTKAESNSASKPESKVVAKTATKPAENKTNKPIANNKDDISPTNAAAKPPAAKAEKSASNEKSGWKTFTDSVKTGVDSQCTQAEIALNQCNK